MPPVLLQRYLIGALHRFEEAGVGNGFPPAFFYNALTVGPAKLSPAMSPGIPSRRDAETPQAQLSQKEDFRPEVLFFIRKHQKASQTLRRARRK